MPLVGPVRWRIVLVPAPSVLLDASSFGVLLLFGVFSSAVIRKVLEGGVFFLFLLLSLVTGRKHFSKLFLSQPGKPELFKLMSGCIEGSV